MNYHRTSIDIESGRRVRACGTISSVDPYTGILPHGCFSYWQKCKYPHWLFTLTDFSETGP